jgi:integrase/recombinase XerD
MDVAYLIRKGGRSRGLRNETIKTYITSVNKFFRVYRLDPRHIAKKDIVQYLQQLRKWGRADSTINVHLNALKFFYEKVLGKKLTVNIPQSRIPKKLPAFLTQDEIKRLFSAIGNHKHLLMIKFLYATGMRVTEFVQLKVQHFEFNDNYGWVRDGKGGKDRLFVLAKKLKGEILAWISSNKLASHDWLFPGQGRHMSTSTVQHIIKKATQQARLTKRVSPHTLRHSFATHLIENGYAVTEVQPLLGHNSVNTTMIYLHMASPNLLKVQSPYDALAEKSVQDTS